MLTQYLTWFGNSPTSTEEAIFIQGESKIYNNRGGGIIHSIQLSSSLFFSLSSVAIATTACCPCHLTLSYISHIFFYFTLTLCCSLGTCL